MSSLLELEPALVWERFLELTRIARPSKAEGPARDHVLAWAAARNLDAETDREGNVVVSVPATTGRGTAPVVVLQAHLDMVCERDPASPFDPREGRIDVRVDDDWVRADGTTLGADNGIGVALALAIADDGAVEHGPLELLFTVSEEQGLDGAKALDATLVSGRTLINLDGTSDEALTVGCAGSNHVVVRAALSPKAPVPERVLVRVEVSGAQGGHSGEDISTGRVSAIKVLGRVLAAGFDTVPFELVELSGGVSRNAIPRSARAVLAVAEAREHELLDALLSELDDVRRQYTREGGLALEVVRDGDVGSNAADSKSTQRALDLICAIPTGVVALIPGTAGAVETSTCLTVATTESGVLTLASMTRSSNASALDELAGSLASVARLGGAEVEIRRSYSPWEPTPDSRLLRTSRATFARLFGTEPALAVVHGGLECAVLGQKLEGVEMISIGPEIVGPHAPGERVRISSTERSYRLLGGLLDDLSR